MSLHPTLEPQMLFLFRFVIIFCVYSSSCAKYISSFKVCISITVVTFCIPSDYETPHFTKFLYSYYCAWVTDEIRVAKFGNIHTKESCSSICSSSKIYFSAVFHPVS